VILLLLYVQQQEEAKSAEMKETFEECGFIYYLILARLLDVDPKMYQKEGSFVRRQKSVRMF